MKKLTLLLTIFFLLGTIVACSPSSIKIKSIEFSTDETELDLRGFGSLTDDDIKPLKHMRNLKTLDLSYNSNISDIRPLKDLTSLEVLYLDGCSIEDISALKGLTNLKWLVLSNNEIRDISPLSNMTKLTGLHLDVTRHSKARINDTIKAS